MIHRALHRIWIGESIPDEYEAYWAKWRLLHPSWGAYTWRKFDWLTNQVEFDAATSPAQKADIARYEILAKCGGVYVDCDVEPLKPLDDLLEARAFAGYEDESNVCNAVLGAERGYPLFETMIERLPGSLAANRDISGQTGPTFLLGVIRSQEWDGLVLHPTTAFYPYSYTETDPGVYPEESYAVHRWARQW
jgi:mannosyltransferase OCH1-like enzyme